MSRAEQLTEAGRQAIKDIVATRCTKLPCSVCEKPDWQGRGFYGLPGIALWADMIGEEIERSLSLGVNAEGVMLAVTCKECGRALFFSVQAVGVNVGR
jgi:hypothetical protein